MDDGNDKNDTFEEYMGESRVGNQKVSVHSCMHFVLMVVVCFD